jgi:hypothetical protein
MRNLEGSSRLHRGMEYLFGVNKPHYKVWLTLCDIDTYPNGDAFHYSPDYDHRRRAPPKHGARKKGMQRATRIVLGLKIYHNVDRAM